MARKVARGMSPEIIGLLMVAAMLLAISIGFPIAFTLLFLGAVFGYWGFGPLVFYLLTLQFNATMMEQTLAAVPLFVFMGIMMEQANLMERLFDSIQKLLAGVRGSLFLAVMFVATIFAAATGIVGASVTILGIMAGKSMIRSGYDVKLSSGLIAAGGTLETIAKERLIVFLDTDVQHLRAGGYIFRVRRPVKDDQPEVTLKFRHPDRYVAESRQMKSRRIRTEIKFEEDIKAPFVSLYSFSSSGDLGKKPVPSTLDDVARLFPDLSKRLGEVDDRHALSEVNDFTARELVIAGATMTIGTKPKVECECALIVWYDQKASADEPVAVEFSYRYGDAKGRYDGKPATRAFDIFETLQRELTEWVDPNPRTKTAFVYG